MTPEQASTVAAFLLPQIEQEIQTTARVLAAVPDDKKDYCPAPKCMTARTLAEHLLGADMWFLESVLNGNFGAHPEPKENSSAELAAEYARRGSELIGKIKQMSGEQLAKDVKFHTMNLPNVAYLEIMQKHSVHHRGQLSAYLRPMGAKVPSIYGGSADEPLTDVATDSK
jgi:uncharacterized damage-inducible protein DinB